MKLIRLTQQSLQLTEAKINSPHLSGLSTQQLIDLLKRKQSHLDRTPDTARTAVVRTLGYNWDEAIQTVPDIQDPVKKQHRLGDLRQAYNYADVLAREYYNNPSEFYVEQTGRKQKAGFSGMDEYVGLPLVIIGKKSALRDHDLDEDDFREFADVQTRRAKTLEGPSTGISGQITRLIKKQNEEQMAIKAAQHKAAPTVNAAPPPRLVAITTRTGTSNLPNPYYGGTHQYYGPITGVTWNSTKIKNIMNTYALALDILGDPMSTINYSRNGSDEDMFYATSMSGQIVFYATSGHHMMVYIATKSYRLARLVTSNNPQATASTLQIYIPAKK
jgi:hypothetical protein